MISVNKIGTPVGWHRAFAQGGGAWSPADLAGLLFDFDASNTANIATGTGNEVATHLDETGTYTLIPVGGVTAPDTGVRTQNGLNCLDGDGTEGLGITSGVSMPVSGNVMFSIAFVIDSVASSGDTTFNFNGAANDFQMDSGNASQYRARFQPAGLGASSFTGTGFPFSGLIIQTLKMDFTNSLITQYIGGTSVGTSAYTVKIDSTGGIAVFMNRIFSAQINGAFCQFVATEDVDETSRGLLETYLIDKWTP